ncbi:hypothetical protein [Methanospirillum hungatei]|uniref:hypothetical protein n=1 Tax=Methanospirillum hungatei TaxID=2203 RepID=UPI0009D1BC0D|nr:hypothetical protein [Methanospirillum hungatei]OQA60433.1 MAG: hypothetical protein BWY45_00136 [Euryarchaeota archaeon ADurb.Bin294]HOW03855.1 hypothetical protein [Methanospirillum hungatei]
MEYRYLIQGIIATCVGTLLWLLSDSISFLAPFPFYAGVLLTIAGIITIIVGTVVQVLKK